MEKYELIKTERGRGYRIRALRNFGDIKRGDLGGYVYGEHNLSHSGDCWIYEGAGVIDIARITDDVRVYRSWIHGNTIVSKNIIIKDTAIYRTRDLHRYILNQFMNRG